MSLKRQNGTSSPSSSRISSTSPPSTRRRLEEGEILPVSKPSHRPPWEQPARESSTRRHDSLTPVQNGNVGKPQDEVQSRPQSSSTSVAASPVPGNAVAPTRHSFYGCTFVKQEYEELGKLGEGTFGEVYKARHRRTGRLVALKKILMHNEKEGFPITAIREIRILKQLSHKNVIPLLEMSIERAVWDKNTKRRGQIYMVTPYMDHDLAGLLENPQVSFSIAQIKCYMIQLLKGTKYLHDNRILHRDMKAANLLIDNRGILKIADFGLARKFEEDPPVAGVKGTGPARREYTNCVVTRWYRPPELLLGERRYTSAIDLWGVGCIFGEMYKHKPILAGNSDLDQIRRIFQLCGSPNQETMPGWDRLPDAGAIRMHNFPRTLESEYDELGPQGVLLLSDLLTLDPLRRITAVTALSHPYWTTKPLPATPQELPMYDSSHEYDRRKFQHQKDHARPPRDTRW
ncbi:kinase-like domain-containing protein [Lipomyces tetrasporus]|uniref:Serine/threonine-protein kinase BUR1 n=1 Tax=Lipomyces tetrasporus TaxID=54092 RepID=A0AAD7QTJ5_9ASCO|nr:kinase-like domain-containing protein [Lipomyces tetrasporus]KAJ8101254.1 kinase-like domain-containing protein [Lipomyces tetrasporus]